MKPEINQLINFFNKCVDQLTQELILRSLMIVTTTTAPLKLLVISF